MVWGRGVLNKTVYFTDFPVLHFKTVGSKRIECTSAKAVLSLSAVDCYYRCHNQFSSLKKLIRSTLNHFKAYQIHVEPILKWLKSVLNQVKSIKI